MSDLCIAQINIARAKYDLEAPEMESFFRAVPAIHALADRSPGFVWRMADEEEEAGLKAIGDPRLVVNITMWETLEALRVFSYETAHSAIMGRKADWFEPLDPPYMALWWNPRTHPPTVAGSMRKLKLLARHGPTPEVFTFREAYDRNGEPHRTPATP